jgi:single-strand DNA-binding protein
MFAQLQAIGRVGRDPEPGTDNKPTRFSIATSRTYKNKSGEKVEETEWINLVAWGSQGELIAKFVTKGRILHVQARPVTREYEDKNGSKQKRTEYVLESFTFLPDGGGKGKQSEPDDGPSGAPSGGSASDGEDDIPF